MYLKRDCVFTLAQKKIKHHFMVAWSPSHWVCKTSLPEGMNIEIDWNIHTRRHAYSRQRSICSKSTSNISKPQVRRHWRASRTLTMYLKCRGLCCSETSIENMILWTYLCLGWHSKFLSGWNLTSLKIALNFTRSWGACWRPIPEKELNCPEELYK